MLWWSMIYMSSIITFKNSESEISTCKNKEYKKAKCFIWMF